MTGSVRTPAQSNRASDIVGRFIAKGGKEKEGALRVVNMLAVEAREQVMLQGASRRDEPRNYQAAGCQSWRRGKLG